jgi:uncharacterized membrane protein
MNKKIRLLPNRFKKAGVLLTVLAFTFAIFSVLTIEFTTFITPDQEPAFRKMSKSLFYLIVLSGLFILSISREKFEDEMLLEMRIKALAIAMLMGVLYSIGMLLMEMFFGHELPDAPSVILMQMIFYLYFLHLDKKEINSTGDVENSSPSGETLITGNEK